MARDSSWHLLRDQLMDGDTLLFDLGNATTEEWWTQIKNYLLKAHGSTLQSVANVIFTGLPIWLLSPDSF